MDEISLLLKEYSKHVLKDEKESNKCDSLSKSDLFGEYNDCWLLLSILLNNLDKLEVSPFYSIKSGEIDKGYQILRIKFLVWLELIYQKSHEISNPKMNPIEFIRRGEHDNFFENYGKKFVSWKAEAFRGLFDSDPSSNDQSFQDFKKNSRSLIESFQNIKKHSKYHVDESKFDKLEKENFEALTGNKKMILKLLQKDPHNEMWAELFASYLNESMVQTNFPIEYVQNFTAIDFQKYCFKLDLFERLHNDEIISKNTSQIDFDSLAFYFNLAIIFQNKKLANYLLCSYISLLYQCKCYTDIFKYTFFLNSQLFTQEESRDSVSFVASMLEPDNSFLDPLRRRERNNEVRDLLLDIQNQIKCNNQKKYLRDLKWIKLEGNKKEELLQLVTDCINRSNPSESCEIIINRTLIELKTAINIDEITRESLGSLATDFIRSYKQKGKDQKVCKEDISDELENYFWDSFLDINNQEESKNKKDYLKALNWLKLDLELVKEDFQQLAIDCTYEFVIRNKFLEARETFEMIKEDISNDFEIDFWNSFLPLSDNYKDKVEKVIASFKELLLWTASMKKDDIKFPFAYETCSSPEIRSRKTNRLINHLFCYITDTYKEKFNEDILNGN